MGHLSSSWNAKAAIPGLEQLQPLVSSVEASWGRGGLVDMGSVPVAILNGKISMFYGFHSRKDTSALSDAANGPSQADELPFETTSKEAFFSRVETFTISFSL